MYEQEVGSIPDELVLDHLCRQPACANPDHLEPVSQRVNRRRGANTRLTAEDVAAIRADVTTSGLELARRYGVSGPHISKIRRGLKWAD